MATLAEQLSQLANPTPVFRDPEDNNDGTSANLSVSKDRGGGDETLEVSVSSLQRRAAAQIPDEDQKYTGKPVSRKRLQNESSLATFDDLTKTEEGLSSEEESSDIDNDESDIQSKDEEDQVEFNSDEDDEGSEEEELINFQAQLKSKQPATKEFSFEDDGDYGQYGESEEDMSSEEDESPDEDDEDEGSSHDDEQPSAKKPKLDKAYEDDQTFSTSSLKEDKEKGLAVKAQLGLWDSLLKGRIELQKLMTVVNRLPQSDTWEEFEAQGGDEYHTAVRQGQLCLKKVLDQLVRLQTALLDQNPDTRHISQGKQQDKDSDKRRASSDGTADDEEITSESEAGSDQDEAGRSAAKRSQQRKRKLALTDYPSFLAERHSNFNTFRNNTIQKWYDKTRVASGKLSKGFAAFEQSALNQIEQILHDKERLISRTQLKRSTYRVLGKVPPKEDDEEDAMQNENGEEKLPVPNRDHLKDYDADIFDDADFYHQLLRELIERKTSDINDPVALTRQWLEIQKLRTKVKKNVDRKASKGRKIRYDVHPKLVNFMAADDTSTWSDEAKNDLFSSLFGKRHEEKSSET